MSDEDHWQYGVRRPDGLVVPVKWGVEGMLMGERVRVRRRVSYGEWEEVVESE